MADATEVQEQNTQDANDTRIAWDSRVLIGLFVGCLFILVMMLVVDVVLRLSGN